jgi:hypothetical protein
MQNPRQAQHTLALLALDRAIRAARRRHGPTTALESARLTLTDAARAEETAREAAEAAGAELDALMARVAGGEPAPAEHFLEVSVRHLEACALLESASAWAQRARGMAAETLAAASLRPVPSRDVASRRARSVRGREPVTQRSPRLLADAGPRSEPLSRRDGVPSA